MFSLLLIKTKRISKAKIKRKAPFPKLKYEVVLPPLITQDC